MSRTPELANSSTLSLPRQDPWPVHHFGQSGASLQTQGLVQERSEVEGEAGGYKEVARGFWA